MSDHDEPKKIEKSKQDQQINHSDNLLFETDLLLHVKLLTNDLEENVKQLVCAYISPHWNLWANLVTSTISVSFGSRTASSSGAKYHSTGRS